MLDVAAVASDAGVFARVLGGDVVNDQGAVGHDLDPANHTEPFANTERAEAGVGHPQPRLSRTRNSPEPLDVGTTGHLPPKLGT